MMKKKGLTLDQHKDIGARLGAVRDEYLELAILIANTYGKTKHAKTLKIVDEIDNVRKNLESELSNEYPEMANEDLINVYYGNRSGKKERGA